MTAAPGIASLHIYGIKGYRRSRLTSLRLTWYCVRALVIIRVERATSGMQNTEDRFVLVRAFSTEDAERRIKKRWREYAIPYLNSNGQMVSWQLEKIVDIYNTLETKIDPAGTEVFSKLHQRRMRAAYVWRPPPARR